MDTSSGADRVTVDLPASIQAPAAARQLVEEVLTRWRLGSIVADASLVVSELVTNALRHAAGSETYSLALVRTEGGIRIALADPSPMLPVVRDLEVEAPHGRGMLIIAALGLAWGWEPEPHGKRVWVDIATGTEEPATEEAPEVEDDRQVFAATDVADRELPAVTAIGPAIEASPDSEPQAGADS